MAGKNNKKGTQNKPQPKPAGQPRKRGGGKRGGSGKGGPPNQVAQRNLPLRLETRSRLAIPGPNVPAMKVMSRVITLPGETRALRFPYISAGLERTALSALREVQTLNWTDHSQDNQLMMLSYSPVCPIWTYQTMKDIRYRYMLSNSFTASGDTIVPGSGDILTDAENYVPWMAHPETQVWFAYIPSGHGFSIQVADFLSGAGPSTCEVELIFIGHGGHITAPVQEIITLTDNVVANGGSVIHPITATKYDNYNWIGISAVRFTGTAKVSNLTNGQPRVTFLIPPTTALHPAVMIPDAKLLPFLRQARVNAASLLVSNTSPDYYKNGSVVGGLIKANETDPFMIADVKQALESLNRASRYDGPAKDGIYTYLPPSNANALTFTDYAIPGLKKFKADGSAEEQCAVLHYGDFERVNYVRFMSDPKNTLTFKMRYDVHIEFVTQSQLFQVMGSKEDQMIFQKIMQASADLTPFTENPLHAAEFAAIAKALFNRLMPYAAPHLRKGVRSAAAMADNWLASYA